MALEQLPKLRGTEMHSTISLSSVDEATIRKLGINVTCEPRYFSNGLYHK